jgi:hypothetical protein
LPIAEAVLDLLETMALKEAEARWIMTLEQKLALEEEYLGVYLIRTPCAAVSEAAAAKADQSRSLT